MSKLDRIVTAYGKRYAELMDAINIDGVFVGDTDRITNEEFREWNFIGSTYNMNGTRKVSGSRPKELTGIETNNGWINIYNSGDLPTERELPCWFDLRGEVVHGSFQINSAGVKGFVRTGNIWLLDWKENGITSYLPIEPPLKRVY